MALYRGLPAGWRAWRRQAISVIHGRGDGRGLDLYGCKPTFWTIPSEVLIGTAVSAGIAMIDAIGNFGGFVGPFAVGWIKHEPPDLQRCQASSPRVVSRRCSPMRVPSRLPVPAAAAAQLG